VRLDALGGRRPETRYIWWVIFGQRVSADRYGVPLSMSSSPQHASANSFQSITDYLTLITAADDSRSGKRSGS